MQQSNPMRSKRKTITIIAISQSITLTEVNTLMQSVIKEWHWLLELQQFVAHSPSTVQLALFASFPSPVKQEIATALQVLIAEARGLTSQQVPRAHTALSLQLIIPFSIIIIIKALNK